MPRVTWSAQAEAELDALVADPAVRDQLRRHAAATLHYVVACSADEGAEDGIMWRRGISDEQERKMNGGRLPDDDDGTRAWDYFLLYRPLNPGAFEVLGVRSNRQIAAWELLYRIFEYAVGPVARSA